MTIRSKIQICLFFMLILFPVATHAQGEMDKEGFTALTRYHISILEQTSHFWTRLRTREEYPDFTRGLFGYFIGCYGDFENTYTLTTEDAEYAGDLAKLNLGLALSFPGTLGDIPIRHNWLISLTDMMLIMEDESTWNFGSGLFVYEADIKWLRFQLGCFFDLALQFSEEGDPDPFSRASVSSLYCTMSLFGFDTTTLFNIATTSLDFFWLSYLINLGKSRIAPFMDYVHDAQAFHLGLTSAINGLFNGWVDCEPELAGDITRLMIDRASLLITLDIDPVVSLLSGKQEDGFVLRLGAGYIAAWEEEEHLFGWRGEFGVMQKENSMGPIYFLFGYARNDYHILRQFDMPGTGLVYIELSIGL
jgi:hypothetical protein